MDLRELRCPRCAARAQLHEPFRFVESSSERAESSGVRWGGWVVIERFPLQLPWSPPPKGVGYQHGSQGLLRCERCHLVRVHRARWPEEAFWQWDLRGRLLWAYTAEHALALYAFIMGRSREASGRYAENLRRVPGEFLLAKRRASIGKALARSLRQEGFSLPAYD